MTIEGNRITSPTSVANAETDKQLAPVSPTGTPWLPQIAVKIATVLVLLAGAIMALPAAGLALPAWLTAIAGAIVTLGTVLGVVSPGARKSDGSQP